MANGNTRLCLTLEPVDSLFFRDARPFEAASRAASGLPMPQTLAGAVRTLLLARHGVQFDQLAAQIRQGLSFAQALAAFGPEATNVADVGLRGPWFSLKGDVLVPAPASLKQEKKASEDQQQETRRVFRLDPLTSPLPGWRPAQPGMLPLWRTGREPVEAVNDFLSLSGLRRFLEGGTPQAGELVPAKDVYDFEDRTGIGVDSKRNTVTEGLIYGIRMLTFKPDVRLYAEVSGPALALEPLMTGPTLMKFGGEGRHVVVQAAESGAVWPSVPPETGKGRIILLTTPASFNGWEPPGLELVAAAVGGFQSVSGWDLAKGGPKPNRFMVPAGSVYFVPSGIRIPDELVEHEEAKAGWGCFAEGNWNDV